MRTIYKYPLKIQELQEVRLPLDPTLLSVQVQNGELCLWAMVDDDNGDSILDVVIVGTGNPAGATRGLNYLGTVQMPPFVWHVFWRESSWKE